MKKISWAIVASLLLLPVASFAQVNSSRSLPKPPASWVAFQKKQKAKYIAFSKQMKAERDAFLNANPDAKVYYDQMITIIRARRAAWNTAHFSSTPTVTIPTTKTNP